MRIPSLIGIAAAYALLGVSAGVWAQTDHLECFKISDTEAKKNYTARLEGFTVEHGCIIRVPARLICMPTTRPEVFPAAPGGPTGAPSQPYLCYKVKCSRKVLPGLTVADRFGSRPILPRRSRLLCAPLASNVTTTTKPDQTPTTTTTAHTTTTVPGGGTTTTTHATTTTTSVVTTTTVPTTEIPFCATANTKCGHCSDGACKRLQKAVSGHANACVELNSCVPSGCSSNADCGTGNVCIDSSGSTGQCCTACP